MDDHNVTNNGCKDNGGQAVYDDRELTQIEVQATYALIDGRFTGEDATRFYIAQTKAGHVLRFRQDLPPELVGELREIAAEEPVVSDLRTGLLLTQEYRKALQRWAPVRRISHGFGYRYPNELPSYPNVVPVTRTNADLGARTFPWLLEEVDDCQPCVARIEEGRLVAVCHSVRITQHAHVAGIDTLERYRGRGHATALAVEWGRAVRALGAEPIYSVAHTNVASQNVAAKAGLVLYNADHHFR